MNQSLRSKRVQETGRLRAAMRAMRAMALAGALGAAWMPVAQARQPAVSLQAPARYPSLPAIANAARLAANCAACHGTNGVTDGVALPSLAGQGKGMLLVALKAFKSGARQGTIMPQIAKGYTDEQLAQLAEFFAAQPAVPTAILPPAVLRIAGAPAGSRP